MKKFLAMILAAMMLLTLAAPLAAADAGSLTLVNATVGETYNVYKILNYSSKDTATRESIFTVATEWQTFVTSHTDVFKKVGTVGNPAVDAYRVDYDKLSGLAEEAATFAKDLTATSTVTGAASTSIANLDNAFYLLTNTTAKPASSDTPKASGLLYSKLFTITPSASSVTIELGSIKIANAKAGVTYEIYRILDLHSYNATDKLYAYKTNTDWLDFIQNEAKGTPTEKNADDVNMFSLMPLDDKNNPEPDFDGNYFATWNGACDFSAENFATLARLAVEYADKNSKIPYDAKKATASGELVFTDLPLGYYVIDTSLGTLCTLDTAKPDATVYEKNAVPTVDKFVQEDSDSSWGKANDDDIGKTIHFKSPITIADKTEVSTDVAEATEKPDNKKELGDWIEENVVTGTKNLIFHDKLSDGFTLKPETIVVKLMRFGNTTETVVDPKNYTIGTTDPDDSYFYNDNDCNVCTFYIKFKDEYFDKKNDIGLGDQLIVYYDAVLNENAVLGEKGNPNKCWITYGDDQKSPPAETFTYTYGIELIKYELVDKEGSEVDDQELLDGAQFELTDASGNKVNLVKITNYTYDDDFDGSTYRTTLPDDEDSAIVDYIDVGRARIIGLDGRTTYTLKEIKAPTGYNKLDLEITVDLNAGKDDNNAENGDYSKDIKNQHNYFATELTKRGDDGTIYSGGYQVENKKGSILPTTGGIGTTIFYIVGGLMMAAAVVLLVTKRKMAAEDNE